MLAEDFQSAKVLKRVLDALIHMVIQISQLEEAKKKAVDSEDFDDAEHYKVCLYHDL
jgi:hypothetical protein